MTLGLCLAAAVVAVTGLSAPEVAHFPGDYFETKARSTLQRRAMERWPGPAQMVERWRRSDLGQRDKIAILLGMAPSHDPVLLPLYREALLDGRGKLRAAAAYGYRGLIADARPDVSGGVDQLAAEQLAAEMDVVAATLRERPLVEMWLQSLLMTEGGSMPGWRGAAMQRPPGVCLAALERVVQFDDVHLVVAAWSRAESRTTRFALMRLLEAMTLKVFFAQPADGHTGWGAKDINEAFDAVDEFVEIWVERRCTTSPELILAASARELGAHGVNPLQPHAWDFWTAVLLRGVPQWRMMAARQLYNLGGRWSELALFASGSARQQEILEDLTEWYRPEGVRPVPEAAARGPGSEVQ